MSMVARQPQAQALPELSYQLMADRAPCVLWTSTADGAWTYVNPAWTRLTGQPAIDALGMGWLDRVPEDERERIAAAFMKGVAAGTAFDVVHDVQAAGGELAVMHLHGQPCFEANRQLGSFSGWLVESPVRHAPPAGPDASVMRPLLDHVPDIIARLDRGLRHVYINRAVGELLGIDADRVIGRTYRELGFSPYMADAYESAVRAVFQSGHERRFDFRADGASAVRHFNVRVVPERDARGGIDTVLVVTYDVTPWIHAQVELDTLLLREQAARSQAESAARARDQFLSVVSHELRSPLNGIQSWTHVLESRVDSQVPAVGRALAGIKTGVQQQVKLIDELLDATRAMTGRLQVQCVAVDLLEAVDRAVARAADQARERQVSIKRHYPEQRLPVWGDAPRIEQIVGHLLANAIKFSAAGCNVDVRVEKLDGDACISVGDTGQGIAPDFMPYLFNPFRQADASATRRTDGLGLGLTLVKYLAELQGGRVAAQSEGERRGAVFSVYLPVARGVPPEPAPMSEEQAVALAGSLAKVRVLLVEDRADARDALSESLRQAGAEVTAYDSGLGAVEHVRRATDGTMPHVLLSDIAMPGLDGCDTLSRIRELERGAPERFRSPLPAIALTASAQSEDRMRALASGFQIYLAKPVAFDQLAGLIQGLARTALGDENAVR